MQAQSLLFRAGYHAVRLPLTQIDIVLFPVKSPFTLCWKWLKTQHNPCSLDMQDVWQVFKLTIPSAIVHRATNDFKEGTFVNQLFDNESKAN